MNTIKKEKKLTYNTPQIEMIQLDNEISLQLQSTPDGEPTDNGWGVSMNQDYFNNNDPFKKA